MWTRFSISKLLRGDHVGFTLRCVCNRIFRFALGLYESFGAALGGVNGIRYRRDLTAFLFVYLVYALLRPEKF